MMKLTRFRITNFRSFVDSGWIDCQDVTGFAGENESGKTSIFLALMKLMDYETVKATVRVPKMYYTVNLKKDLPMDRFDELLPLISETVFIQAEFDIAESNLNEQLSALNSSYRPRRSFTISKTFGNVYNTDFRKEFSDAQWPLALAATLKNMPVFAYYREVTEISTKVDFITLALKLSGEIKKKMTSKERAVCDLLESLNIWTSNIVNSIMQVYNSLTVENKKKIDFMEIFHRIPQLRDRIERGFKQLSNEFVKWWGKDDISIGFEPYNKGIIIQVMDNKGGNFLLADRSTGLRRFFALFLSFSVVNKFEDRRRDDVRNRPILLFDEAGAALHPLMQTKLEHFFTELSKQSQLMYNTHTSYMLSIENLNRVRAVYKNERNQSLISPTLRVTDDRLNELSLYPIQSALALYIAQKQMAGCLPIIVLDDQDEYYLSLIKNILCGFGKLRTVYNTLVFAAGKNGVDAVAEMFSANDKDMPLILLPSTTKGKLIKERLLGGKYKNDPRKILELQDFIKDAEAFEDIMPGGFMELFSRLYLHEILGKGFVYDKGQPFIKQIEAYALQKGITLPADYRSETARRMKLNTMMNFGDVKRHIKGKYLANWIKIWKALLK